MLARDLADRYPYVRPEDGALDAARMLAEGRLPGLLVVDDRGVPRAVLPASQVVRALVPGYVLDDPALAAVVDEPHADQLSSELSGRLVRELVSDSSDPPPIADGGDTLLDVAALMATTHSPLVAVVEHGDQHSKDEAVRPLGVITASHLLNQLLGLT